MTNYPENLKSALRVKKQNDNAFVVEYQKGEIKSFAVVRITKTTETYIYTEEILDFYSSSRAQKQKFDIESGRIVCEIGYPNIKIFPDKKAFNEYVVKNMLERKIIERATKMFLTNYSVEKLSQICDLLDIDYDIKKTLLDNQIKINDEESI